MKGKCDRRCVWRREKLNELLVNSQWAVYGAELPRDMQQDTELAMVLYALGNNRWSCLDVYLQMNKYNITTGLNLRQNTECNIEWDFTPCVHIYLWCWGNEQHHLFNLSRFVRGDSFLSAAIKSICSQIKILHTWLSRWCYCSAIIKEMLGQILWE